MESKTGNGKMNKYSGQDLTVEEMKERMRQFFPHLKRWGK